MTIDRDPLDPALDALLRAHSNAMPPAQVDAAILSAAHRAVASAPRKVEDGAASRSWRRWLPLAAAATIAAVAFGVLQVAPTDTRDASPVVGDTPISVPAVPDAGSARDAAAINSESSAGKATQPAAPQASAPTARAQRESATPPPSAKREPVTPLPSAKRETATPAAETGSGAQRERASAPQPFLLQKRQAANAFAPSAPAPAAAAAAQRESAGTSTGALRADQAASIEPRSVAEWIARIRALRDEGKLEEAAQAVAQFRAAYASADSRLPDDLRAWAESIVR